MVWVNQAGQLTDSPLQPSQVAGRTELAEGSPSPPSRVTLIAIGLAGRWALDRRRLARVGRGVAGHRGPVEPRR